MASDGRYVLFKKIARGGMAEIFLGKQIGEDGFQRICCIKRILPHYAQDKEFIEMFRDEAHISKRLQHANIARVEGFEEVEGSYAMIMEFVDGADLRSILSSCEKSKTRLTVPMVVFIIAESARGLHYAHTKKDDVTRKPLNIVHRDISPQNLLLSFEGEIKVTDFGIADAGNKETETKPGVVKGKYAYMSPEQISAKAVDARTDVFALAIVLWESLAMKRLFHGENDVQTIQLVKTCKIPHDIRKLNPQIDNELEAILLKALSKEASNRFENAGVFEKELRRYLSHNFPEFTPEDLGNFLKALLETKRMESQDSLKQLLSQEIKPTPVSKSAEAPSFSVLSSNKDKKEIELQQDMPQVHLKTPAQLGASTKDHYSAVSYSYPTKTNRPGMGTYSDTTSYTGLRRSPHFWSTVLIALTVFGLIAGIGAVFYRRYLNQQAPANLEIQTTPATVKLILDGKPLFQGRYVKTPISIKKIPNGSHTLGTERTGFSGETLTFEATPNKTIRKTEIVLRQVEQMAPSRITLRAGSSQTSIKVFIDDGEVSGDVTESKGLNADYITFGKPHILKVFPKFPDSDDGFQCSFTPRAQTWRAPYLIQIDLKTRNCSYPVR